MKQYLLIYLLVLTLVACQSYPPPPVINRSPPAAAENIENTPNTRQSSIDNRPDSYVVKQGDTLYSISLAFGYYYKDIAAANNIDAPYLINMGQLLDFSPLNKKPEAKPASDDVIITPINIESASAPSVTPMLSQPKAVREPYSLDALNRKAAPTITFPTVASIAKPNKDLPDHSNVKVVDNLNWVWPTSGKVTEVFNQASNKGIDIAGRLGQTIKAAGDGKIIYSGADLRGYGKLVIIKHNKTYLSVYAHNNRILVKEGQLVKAGQKIAEMGKTDTSSVKLHYEIRKHGKSIDPVPYLPQN